MKSISLNMKAQLLDALTFTIFIGAISYLSFPSMEDQLVVSTLWLHVMILLGAFSIGFFTSIGLQGLSLKTWGEKVFPQSPHRDTLVIPYWKELWFWHAVVFLITIFITGLIITRFSLYELSNADGLDGAWRLIKGISTPDWSLLPKAILNMVETIFMAFTATALAIPMAFILSFVASRNLVRGPIGHLFYFAIRTLLNVTRSVEALIWAIIFSVWVGIGPFAGMLALMIHSVASLTKQYSEIVEAVNEGPLEAILSTGANHVQMIWFAVVPQVVLPFIAFTVYRWDINVRMATVIGLVGGGGIGTLLIQYQGQAMWPQVGCIIFVIAVVVTLLDQASAYLREILK